MKFLALLTALIFMAVSLPANAQGLDSVSYTHLTLPTKA